MPFKDKLIKQLQKCINHFLEPINDKQHQITNEHPEKNKILKKKVKKITLKVNNIYERFLRKMPLTCVHVANFFNLVGINEEAIRSEDFEESYCRTVFYLQSIKKAEIKQHYIVFHLKPSNFTFAPVQYSIQRFKSFGDIKFFNIAHSMQQLYTRLHELKDHIGKPIKQDNNDLFEKYLQSLGNKMYVVKNSSKMVISKAFLELLEFNPEEFVLDGIKFRSSIYEGCSAQNYYSVMLKSLENVKNLIDLLFDKISLQAFLDNSIMRFRDFLYTKHHKRVFAKLKVGMPNPCVTIYEVQQVINIADQFTAKPYFKGEKKKQLQALKCQCETSDIKTVRNLLKLPSNYLPQNKYRVTNYVQKKSNCKQQQQ